MLHLISTILFAQIAVAAPAELHKHTEGLSIHICKEFQRCNFLNPLIATIVQANNIKPKNDRLFPRWSFFGGSKRPPKTNVQPPPKTNVKPNVIVENPLTKTSVPTQVQKPPLNTGPNLQSGKKPPISENPKSELPRQPSNNALPPADVQRQPSNNRLPPADVQRQPSQNRGNRPFYDETSDNNVFDSTPSRDSSRRNQNQNGNRGINDNSQNEQNNQASDNQNGQGKKQGWLDRLQDPNFHESVRQGADTFGHVSNTVIGVAGSGLQVYNGYQNSNNQNYNSNYGGGYNQYGNQQQPIPNQPYNSDTPYSQDDSQPTPSGQFNSNVDGSSNNQFGIGNEYEIGGINGNSDSFGQNQGSLKKPSNNDEFYDGFGEQQGASRQQSRPGNDYQTYDSFGKQQGKTQQQPDNNYETYAGFDDRQGASRKPAKQDSGSRRSERYSPNQFEYESNLNRGPRQQ